MYRSRPYPKGCSGVALRCDRLPPTRSSSWLPESATEWIDSASIEDEPVSSQATNFVTAIPRFAVSAAMIALVPPSALMPGLRRERDVRGTRRVRWSLDSLGHRVGQFLHLVDRGHRHRVEPMSQREVQRGEVGY